MGLLDQDPSTLDQTTLLGLRKRATDQSLQMRRVAANRAIQSGLLGLEIGSGSGAVAPGLLNPQW